MEWVFTLKENLFILETIKHLRKYGLHCDNCNACFKTKSGIWKHKKKCIPDQDTNTDDLIVLKQIEQQGQLIEIEKKKLRLQEEQNELLKKQNENTEPKQINNTINNNKLHLNLAFNYGFKDEIKDVLSKVRLDIDLDLNNSDNIKKLFYLGMIPDPEILIRTGGDKRLSNFIMYNLTYSEIFFIETLWPDFHKVNLINIIDNYKKISRRYGL